MKQEVMEAQGEMDRFIIREISVHISQQLIKTSRQIINNVIKDLITLSTT